VTLTNDPDEADLSWAGKWLSAHYRLDLAEGASERGFAAAQSLSQTTERAAAALAFGDEPSGFWLVFNPSRDDL
jgi:hypothetical protein